MLLGYIAVKITRAVRNLTETRIACYTEHLAHLQRMADAARRNEPCPKVEAAADKSIDVFASFPVLRASAAAYGSLTEVHRLKQAAESAARIEAAIQKLEAALVELNVRMRDDLALNTGNGRFPNAEVFRTRRGKRDA